jgi:hypothetical protein
MRAKVLEHREAQFVLDHHPCGVPPLRTREATAASWRGRRLAHLQAQPHELADAALVGAAHAQFSVAAGFLRRASGRPRLRGHSAAARGYPRIYRRIAAEGSRRGMAVRTLRRLGGIRVFIEWLDLAVELIGGRMRHFSG